jgi:putative tryptophan/tyrosine transport system substrate-binding protein
LPALAADLIQSKVAVIVTVGGTLPALEAKRQTTTIPIVVAMGSDPVKNGLVASLNRPGNNVTGVTLFNNELEAKRIELLRELVPRAKAIAVLSNPTNPNSAPSIADMQLASSRLGIRLFSLPVDRDEKLEAAFAAANKDGADALLVQGEPFFNARQKEIVSLAARYRLPTSYSQRPFVQAGGLMSYGTDRVEAHRQVGAYVARILNGEVPADLPFLQPSKIEFVINLKTAKALGLDVPLNLHAFADEVIE